MMRKRRKKIDTNKPVVDTNSPETEPTLFGSPTGDQADDVAESNELWPGGFKWCCVENEDVTHSESHFKGYLYEVVLEYSESDYNQAGDVVTKIQRKSLIGHPGTPIQTDRGLVAFASVNKYHTFYLYNTVADENIEAKLAGKNLVEHDGPVFSIYKTEGRPLVLNRILLSK